MNSPYYYTLIYCNSSMDLTVPLSKSQNKLTAKLFRNHWVTFQTNDTCVTTSLFALFFSLLPVFLPFSLCVYMFGPGSSLLIWTHKPGGQWCSLCKLNCVNFASTLKLVMWVLWAAWSTQHRWLSKEEVNGTGKQEVPVRWLTACLDTKRWILKEHWLTDKSPLTNRI